MDERRERDGARRVDRERDGRRRDDRRDDRRDYNDDRRDDRRDYNDDRRDDRRDYYDDRRDDRRDYYDDRRDDHRYARGARYSSSWWISNSCSRTVVVVLDGYSYYQCNDSWFGRTYYGGEVTYTVVDAPEGY